MVDDAAFDVEDAVASGQVLHAVREAACPRRRPLGVRAAATSQPPRHGSGVEVGGLAAHKGRTAMELNS